MLLQENLRRGRELSEAANRVGQVLHGRLETREIIRQIVDEGASALGSETAAISERVEGGWVVRHVHGLPAELVGAQMTDQTEHHAVMAIKSGDVLPVEDAFNDDRFNQEHLRKHNVRSVLVAPLIMQGRPFGVVFFNYHSNRHAFTEAEVGFARQVAATAASALENARLFEERVKAEQALAESKKRVEVLARAASVLLRAEDPQAVLEELCCEVRCFLGCDVFFNFLLDGAQRKLKLNACGGVDHRIARVVEGLELCESLCGSAAETGARVVARDVDRSDDTRAAVVKRLGIRAYAAHPLLGAKGEVLGTVSFGTRERGSFTAEDLELMKAVADHVAVALVKKRAEEALRTANQRLEYHVQNTPLAVIEFDAALRVSTWNDGAQRVFGWDAAEVVGRPMCDIPWIPEEDQARVEGVAAALVSGQTIRSVNINRNLRKDGKEIWCEWHNSSLTDPSGKMQSIQSLILDVTVSREAQAVLTRDKAELERLVRERTAKLEELVAELEHFSYSITHDMRAPLRGMQGFAEAMTEACLGCQRNDSLGFMKRIRTSASRMDLLITDALQYAKAVRKELPLGPVDTGELLRGMLDSYPELQRSKAKIELRGELPVVMGNEAGLTQVFSNLLGNAVKFVRPGQVPEICVWAEVLVRGSQPERQQADSKRPRGYQALNSPDVAGGGGRDGQQGGGAILETDRWVRIWVEDNGIGILPMMKSKVFDMFARGHDGEQYEGTGIGLALVRKVAQRMGGRVGVESEPGKGSRFWVELRDGRTQGM
jgi:PAS domain S-box-containing protein